MGAVVGEHLFEVKSQQTTVKFLCLQDVSLRGFTTSVSHHTEVPRKPILTPENPSFLYFGFNFGACCCGVLHCISNFFVCSDYNGIIVIHFGGHSSTKPKKNCCWEESASFPVGLGIFPEKVQHNTG